ncbi:cytosolic iron-sulfur protein assembly protein CIAO1-like [Homarus americanus]|uniref:Cytosolic iron-sulfur protein assembly protein CIAO1-like n=1 Tax=Homarus americanus TaxID=6706 RepID=A0A8J5NEL6_HOMAM|nr:cytosolic iron-sulfur protein assembly protein CIAO1-like [Homarus americanus]
MPSHTQDVKKVVFHPSADILASASYDNSIKLYKEDVDDWAVFCTLNGHESTVWGLAFDASGHRLASCSDDGTVKIWQEYHPGNEEGITHQITSLYGNVCVHYLGITVVQYMTLIGAISGAIVTSCGDDAIRDFKEQSESSKNAPVYDLIVTIPQAHTEDVNSVAWNPVVGGLLASASDDGTVKIWDFSKIF